MKLKSRKVLKTANVSAPKVISFSRAKGPAPEKREPLIRAFLKSDLKVVDHFAGGGGASSGVADAMAELLGVPRHPDIAINHDPEAIAMHKANHPETKHYIKDVFEVDPREAIGNNRVGFLWASPTCQHFSKAKGTALDATSVKLRGLCWVVTSWAARVDIDCICMENVEEFVKFGPLHRQHTNGCKGKRENCLVACRIHKPIKEREGELFDAFISRLERLGYVVEWRILRAHDYGAPTTRKRWFLVARKDGKPIVWPEPTHGPGRAHPYRTAAECIDWDITCPSIFERERPLADKTLARIARGVDKFVLNAARPFIVPVAYGDKGGTDVRVNSVDEPMRTICGNRGGHQVVVPYLVPNNTNNVPKGADEPVPTITTGNRNYLVSPILVPATHGDKHGKPDTRTHSPEEPLRTLTTRGAQYSIAAPLLMKAKTYGGGGNDAKPANEPLGTVTASKRGEHAIAVPYLVHRSNGERPEKIDEDGTVHTAQAPRIYDAQQPLGTIMAQGQKHALSMALLVKNNGGNNDRNGNMSGQTVERPIDTIACRDQKSLAVVHLARYNGERREGEARGATPDAPLSTLDTSNRHTVVASHLVKMRGTSAAHVAASGHSMREPLPTISARGTHFAKVAAYLVRYNRTGGAESADAPIPTLTTKERFGLVEVTLAKDVCERALRVAEFLGYDKPIIVEIGGEEWVFVDIGMRMLIPRELFRAQGFPPDYIIEPEYNGKPMTKTAQIRMCGNSVPPVMAKVIAKAQLEAA